MCHCTGGAKNQCGSSMSYKNNSKLIKKDNSLENAEVGHFYRQDILPVVRYYYYYYYCNRFMTL